jgi:hypothetical protein
LRTLRGILDREEKELNKRGVSFHREDVWRCADVPDPIVARTESDLKVWSPLPHRYRRMSRIEFVARKYEIEIDAAGYQRESMGNSPEPRRSHAVGLFILRNYPSRVYGNVYEVGRVLSFILEWLTPIFHPNIDTGSSAGGTGIVYAPGNALDLYFGRQVTLVGIIDGLKSLVENPYMLNYLLLPECRDAWKWFDARKRALCFCNEASIGITFRLTGVLTGTLTGTAMPLDVEIEVSQSDTIFSVCERALNMIATKMPSYWRDLTWNISQSRVSVNGKKELNYEDTVQSSGINEGDRIELWLHPIIG